MKESSRLSAIQLCNGFGRAVQTVEWVKEVSEGEISRRKYGTVRLSDAFDHVENSIMKYSLCYVYPFETN